MRTFHISDNPSSYCLSEVTDSGKDIINHIFKDLRILFWQTYKHYKKNTSHQIISRETSSNIGIQIHMHQNPCQRGTKDLCDKFYTDICLGFTFLYDLWENVSSRFLCNSVASASELLEKSSRNVSLLLVVVGGLWGCCNNSLAKGLIFYICEFWYAMRILTF